MNIFIGIMSSSYDKYEDQAQSLFTRERARIETMYIERAMALSSFLHCLCCRSIQEATLRISTSFGGDTYFAMCEPIGRTGEGMTRSLREYIRRHNCRNVEDLYERLERQIDIQSESIAQISDSIKSLTATANGLVASHNS